MGELCVLTSVGDETLAHIIKGMLEAEDIPVMVRGVGDAALWISGGRSGAFAIDVLVLERDLGAPRRSWLRPTPAQSPREVDAGGWRPSP